MVNKIGGQWTGIVLSLITIFILSVVITWKNSALRGAGYLQRLTAPRISLIPVGLLVVPFGKGLSPGDTQAQDEIANEKRELDIEKSSCEARLEIKQMYNERLSEKGGDQ